MKFKNSLILGVLLITVFTISLAENLQSADATITSVTIGQPVTGQSFGADFGITYFFEDSGGNTVGAGTITYTRTGGTEDSGSHVYTMVDGDFDGPAGVIVSRATLEADPGFDDLVDGAIYTVVVSVTDTGSDFTDTETDQTADFTLPTFTAVHTTPTTTVVTFSEPINGVWKLVDWAVDTILVTGIVDNNGAVEDSNAVVATSVTLTHQALDTDDSIKIQYFTGNLKDDADINPNSMTDATSFTTSAAPVPEKKGGGGCSGDCEAPTMGVLKTGRQLVDNGFSYNGNPVDVKMFFTPYPLITVNIGESNTAEFKIYDNMGSESVAHFELAFGLGKGESIDKSQAIIIWDRTFDGIETVELEDPDNTLENVFVTTSEVLCQEDGAQMCLLLQIHHTFRAPLEFNVLGSNVWDLKRNAWQNYYNHGIEVEGDSKNAPLTKEIPGSYKHEGIITVTQTELYSDLWVASDGRIFEMFGDSDSFKLVSQHFERNQDKGDMKNRSHSAFNGWKQTQADFATTIFDSSKIQKTLPEFTTLDFPTMDSRTQFLIDNELMHIRK